MKRDSVRDRISTATLALNLAPEEAHMHPEPSVTGATVLIVDDVPANLGLLRSALEPHGFNIMAACDGESTIEILRHRQPDIILLDVMMPGMSGFECCRKLREDASTADIPIIFVTAKNDLEHMSEGFRSGGNDYITKPYQIEEVLVRLETHLMLGLFRRNLRDSNEALEQQVNERTKELQQTNQSLLQENAERRRLEATRLELLKRLVKAQEKERYRIASELHDSIGQNLLIMINRADPGPELDHDAALLRDRLTELHGFLKQTISDVREISYNLRPYLLEKNGLSKAIQSMVNKVKETTSTQFETKLDSVEMCLDHDTELQVYRMIQECVNNVVKHSKASQAQLEMIQSDDLLTVTIEDNGVGFDWNNQQMEPTTQSGFGLMGISDRVRLMNGNMRCQSTPGQGTKLSIEIPMSKKGDHKRTSGFKATDQGERER